MQKHTCPSCHNEFLYTFEFWNKRKNSKSGFSTYCKECSRKIRKKYFQNNKNKCYEAYWNYRKEVRRKCLYHYSKGKMECECCKEKELVFLTLDHINEDGAAHRRSFGERGNFKAMRRAIIEGYPDIFQVLCWNCNLAKHMLGKCPHQKDFN